MLGLAKGHVSSSLPVVAHLSVKSLQRVFIEDAYHTRYMQKEPNSSFKPKAMAANLVISKDPKKDWLLPHLQF